MIPLQGLAPNFSNSFACTSCETANSTSSFVSLIPATSSNVIISSGFSTLNSVVACPPTLLKTKYIKTKHSIIIGKDDSVDNIASSAVL